MKLINRIIKTILLFTAILALLGIVFTSLYGEKIEQYILENIREKSIAEIAVRDINFSVFENFPYASVKFSDVLILEKEPNEHDTLLYVNQGYLQFNLFNLINKNKEISKIVLLDSKLNIKYDQEGEPNFIIFKETEEQIKLDEIYFDNCLITYIHELKQVNIKSETDKILFQTQENKQADFLVNGDLFIQNFWVGKINYIHKKQTKIDAEFTLNDGVFEIQRSNIGIEEVNFNLDGKVKNQEVDLNISAKNQQLKSMLLHTPEQFKSIYESFTLEGELNCQGIIKGTINKTTNPHFNMDFDFSNAEFRLRETPFFLFALQLSGNIDNGSKNNFETTKIKTENCFAKIGDGTLSGSFEVQNLNNYYLTADINSKLDLAETNHLFKTTPFFNMQGKLVANTKYSGYLAFSRKMKNYFLAGEHISNLQLEDVKFQYKTFPLVFGLNNLKGKIHNDILNLESSDITVADSDLKFKGSITKFTSYFLNNSSKISVQGELESVYIKFDELMTVKDMNNDKKPISTLPNWLELDLKTQIEQLSYQYFTAEQINAEIEYKNFTLKAKNVTMSTLNGEIRGEAKFYERPYNYLKLFASAHLEKINIRNLFTGFENFGQEFIQDKHLKGEGTADIQLQSSWNPGFKFDREKLQLNSHLIIEKGELISFAPLLNLSSYVSVDELKDVKFSTLENTIKIANNNINIPAMEIKSSALSVFISGTHNFNNDIDYQIKLLLSELISKKARKRNTDLDKQLFVQDDGLGKTTLYLKMDGNVDNPNIYFDKIRIKEKLKQDIKEEKAEIKKIVQEEILNQKTDSIKRKEDADVILEWEDE